MKMIWFAPLLFLTLLFSCNNPVKLSDDQPLRFDSEKYFLTEVQLLNDGNAGLIKTIKKNNVSEEISIQKADWKSELMPFLQIKLNKPAQFNSFLVDTIVSDERIVVIYTAKDDSEELRKLSLYLTGENPDSIIAIKEASNLYYKSADTISYLGNGNYRISTHNKPRIGKEVSFSLKGVSQISK